MFRALLALALFAVLPAQAQDWPTRPVRQNARPDPDPYAAVGYPGGEKPLVDDTPTDPTMRVPLNDAPREEARERRRRLLSEVRHMDLVVPRVYLEPDERIDRLRARALWWSITRDMVAVCLGLYLLGSWVITPLWRALGG